VGVLSSDSVELPMPGISPYAASKAAINHLLESWRLEERQVRFSRITVGNTGGTDFARDFDQQAAAEMLPGWVSLGRVAATMMEPIALGTLITDTLTFALNTPGVDPQHYRFMPPGGPLTDASALLAAVDEVASRT
jgi:NAD(P)-dependent dehydrogenase (short-subunit alcohol dehydrogenase family)